MILRFFVPGVAAPQGSHKGFVYPLGKCKRCNGAGCGGNNRSCIKGVAVRAAITEDNKKVDPWRQAVAGVALHLRTNQPALPFGKGVALELSCVFARHRPKGHTNDIGALLKPGRDAPWPTTKPDADKLTRAIGDSLKGVLYHDDSQLCLIQSALVWTRGVAGLYVRLATLHTVPRWCSDLLSTFGVSAEGGELLPAEVEHGFTPLNGESVEVEDIDAVPRPSGDQLSIF